MEWLKSLPRLKKPHFYWPGNVNEPPEHYQKLAGVLGTVNIKVDSNTHGENLERLKALAEECAANGWALGLHHSPLYDEPWKRTHDPRIGVESGSGAAAIDWWIEEIFESVDAVIRGSKRMMVRWFLDAENFKAGAHAAALGLTVDAFDAAVVALFSAYERRMAAVFPPQSVEWYGMGWRQWNGGVPDRNGTSHPQSVQREYVPTIESQRHRGQVVIDRPQYPEGWQTSYFASMTGRIVGTAWAWLWMAKKWISSRELGLDTAGGGRTPIEWRQSDVAGDYGMLHAREMGRRLAALPRIDKVIFYPRPAEWGDGTHLLHYVCGYAGLPFTPPLKIPQGATVGNPAVPVAAVKAAEQIKPKGST